MMIESIHLNDFTNQQVGLDQIWSEIRAVYGNGLDTIDNNGQTLQAPNIDPYAPPKPETPPPADSYTNSSSSDSSIIRPRQQTEYVKITSQNDVDTYVENIKEAVDRHIKPLVRKYRAGEEGKFDGMFANFYKSLEGIQIGRNGINDDTSHDIVRKVVKAINNHLRTAYESLYSAYKFKNDKAIRDEVHYGMRQFFQYIGGDCQYGFEMEGSDRSSCDDQVRFYTIGTTDPSLKNIIKEINLPVFYISYYDDDDEQEVAKMFIQGTGFYYKLVGLDYSGG